LKALSSSFFTKTKYSFELSWLAGFLPFQKHHIHSMLFFAEKPLTFDPDSHKLVFINMTEYDVLYE